MTMNCTHIRGMTNVRFYSEHTECMVWRWCR